MLKGITFTIEKGMFVGIIGPNGSGKSTLLKAISRVLKPVRGGVYLSGENVYRLKPKTVAGSLAVIPQETSIEFPVKVNDMVLMGRSPHVGFLKSESAGDYEAALKAMEMTNTAHLAQREVTAISGGERQRAVIARALAQEPEVLLLDEPTAHLDINHQLEIMTLIHNLNKKNRLTVISVFHDLNVAAQYCDRIIMLKKGSVFRLGTPEDVLTTENIKDVYGTNVLIRKSNITGRPHVTLIPGSGATAKTKGRAHIICGGGAGSIIINLLISTGYALTAGVINIGDMDWETARLLNVKCIEEPPFSPVSEQSHEKNLGCIFASDVCIMAEIPFGIGNLKNAEAALTALRKGKPVIIVEKDDIRKRDYTGGEAGKIYQDVKKEGGIVVNDAGKIPAIMDDLKINNIS